MKQGRTFRDNIESRNAGAGIVVPAVMWWLGVPISFLLVLWLVGVF
jgi:hypothetical protein